MTKQTLLDFDINLKQTLEKKSRLTPRILLGFLLLSSITLLISAFSFGNRLNNVHLANSDNIGWIIAQIEVDHQGLMLRLSRTLPRAGGEQEGAMLTSLDIEKIKQDFDIFYSRVTVFEVSLRRLNVSNNLLSKLQELKDIRRELAEKIDKIDNPDVAELLHFEESVSDIYPLVRDIAVSALQETVEYTARVRQNDYLVYFIFLVLSIFLVTLMLVSLFLAVRIWRDLESKTIDNLRIGGIFSHVLDTMLNGVIITDQDAYILYSNPMAKKIFGSERTSIDRQNIHHVITLEEKITQDTNSSNYNFGQLSPFIDAGPSVINTKNADGNPIFVEIRLVRENDLAGREVVICFIRDITEQVVAENGLRNALRLAEEASTAKSSFLATMSHEMRTPLHGIMASLDLLKDSDLDGINLNLLETAEACSRRALAQINNVLEMARIGYQQETPTKLCPVLIAQDILRELQPLADSACNTLELIVHGSFEDHRLKGFPYTFSQVLYNLVDNAIKFTESGSITVSMELRVEEMGVAILYVEVVDTGIGISEDAQNYIFEEFKTLNSNSMSARSGSGLGLAIAKRGVNMQGGELFVSSTPGKGSCFYFHIPLQAEAGKADIEPAKNFREFKANISKNYKILVVDDSEVNLVLMREMLHRIGHEVDLAENGEIAVEKASGGYYDFILMDFSMPYMDGPTAAKKIRSMPSTASQVVIIGVTALIDAKNDDRNIDLFDEILIKPVGILELAATIEAFEKKSGCSTQNATLEMDVNSSEAIGENDLEVNEISANFDEVISLLGRSTAIRLMEMTIPDVELSLATIYDVAIPISNKVDQIHKSVGSTAVLGLLELSEALYEAEAMALSGQDPINSPLAKYIEKLLNEAKRKLTTLTHLENQEDYGE